MSGPAVGWERVRAWQGWQQRRPPRGMVGAVFWLAIWFCVLSLLRLLHGTTGTLSAVLQVMVGVALVLTGVPILWRIVRQRLLWSLRNKLVLTYLLIGLAPLVLFSILVLVSAYIVAGQFAIHLVDARLQSHLDQVKGLNSLDEWTLEKRLRLPAGNTDTSKAPNALAELRFTEPQLQESAGVLTPQIRVFRNGLQVAYADQRTERVRTPLGLPPWATRLPGGRFRGMVLDEGELYLVGIEQVEITPGDRYSLISSLPVDGILMRTVAHNLGRARLIAVATGEGVEAPVDETATIKTPTTSTGAKPSAKRAREIRTPNQDQIRQGSVMGGEEPDARNVLDLRVRFLSTIPVVNWDTGVTDNAPIEVVSRPSRLYRALFGASLGGRILRIGLIILCVLFAAIESLALWMAARLSRTVTASVTDLYDATQRIDRGEFHHRIGVERDDQMADLNRSFNTMTGSLERLLQEQKEKERLQNELSIAQEVQANLFPLNVKSLPTLELHGVCRPARAVSGDYYDFLMFDDIEGMPGYPSGVGIALGDISGKGISAALLMATLHSAVRAYRLASEELLLVGKEAGSELMLVGKESSSELKLREKRSNGGAELFESPGRILALLNRHLYRSTQPEKYATLFLAHYDARSARLTYSNAGQLPPLVLRPDGSVRRLDCGGTVVGLLDGMEYEQETIQMRSGDIMVAYSDGVTEPENDFGDFGEDRMMDVVRRYRHEPLHVISSQVMQALDAWIGAEEQPDDITLVLARQV